MVTVYITEDMPFDRAIKKFKKLCEKNGIFDEIRKRSYYVKPSQKRRNKSKEAQLRLLRELNEEEMPYM